MLSDEATAYSHLGRSPPSPAATSALMQIGLASTFSSGMPSCRVAWANLTQSLGLMTGITRSTFWAPAARSGTVRSGVLAG